MIRNGMIAGFAVIALCACTEQLPTVRYRVTVEVDTPQGLRSASSVVEMKSRLVPTITEPTGKGLRKSFTGEAVALDMPDGQTLFALLKGARSENTNFEQTAPFFALKPRYIAGRGFDGVGTNLQILKQTKGAGVLPPEHYPMFVRFGDLNDPKSLELVKPDDLSTVFGPGVALRRITIEITDDPPSSVILNRLPWLATHRGQLRKSALPEERSLTSVIPSHFKREIGR